ncbi:MAG: OmpA family protein [Flavobacteriales bacterium]|nr:OmpA family protein [Flavobacteriales bacterium]
MFANKPMMRSFFLAVSLVFSCCLISAQELQQHVFNIYFKSNSDMVSQKAKGLIRKQLLEIGSQNIREIIIKGHTDSDANDSFNIMLSEKRVKSTRSFLLTQGVPSGMISSESYGESDPVSELKSMNRRVEITLVYDYNFQRTGQKDKRYYIKGYVYDFNTNNPLRANLVIEDKNLNVFKQTDGNGLFGFNLKSSKSLKLTFSREGYLSHGILLDAVSFQKALQDTLYLKIALKPVEVVEKIIFDHIYFYSDSDSLKPESNGDLLKLVSMLKNNKNLFIEIQGHMNCPLSRPQNIYQARYNNELSHKRARAVYNYLLKNNIPAGQLTFKGLGNQNMIYPEPQNLQEADKNKRVEVWKLKVIEK